MPWLMLVKSPPYSGSLSLSLPGADATSCVVTSPVASSVAPGVGTRKEILGVDISSTALLGLYMLLIIVAPVSPWMLQSRRVVPGLVKSRECVFMNPDEINPFWPMAPKDAQGGGKATKGKDGITALQLTWHFRITTSFPDFLACNHSVVTTSSAAPAATRHDIPRRPQRHPRAHENHQPRDSPDSLTISRQQCAEIPAQDSTDMEGEHDTNRLARQSPRFVSGLRTAPGLIFVHLEL